MTRMNLQEIANTNFSAPTIYGTHLPGMIDAMNSILDGINQIRRQMALEESGDLVDHLLARIKSDESMREKLRSRGMPETTESALERVRDAIGVRVVCSFLSDVYTIRDRIRLMPRIKVVDEKDYIRHAKDNGYRSYHMILKAENGYIVEVQLRTISMDTWAALEHQLNYKKTATPSDVLIANELKRCADELASTDISMQTIRDMINGMDREE